MTDRKAKKRRRLMTEILLLICICIAVCGILFRFLTLCGLGVAESYLFLRDIELSLEESSRVDSWITNISLVFAVGSFTAMLLALLGDRLSYVRKITKGIEMLDKDIDGYTIPLEGNNELTTLCERINSFSAAQRDVREREKKVAEEKEEFIRAMSHDIRTPLTSIIAYAELLSGDCDLGEEKRSEYLQLIKRKSLQIKELTDILLDEKREERECFEDCGILFRQLCDEFEDEAAGFSVSCNVIGCDGLRGCFGVTELRRIFDNLASNIRKYADRAGRVELNISADAKGVLICQKNKITPALLPVEGFGVGIKSIRRIADNYGGGVWVSERDGTFEISIRLSEILP